MITIHCYESLENLEKILKLAAELRKGLTIFPFINLPATISESGGEEVTRILSFLARNWVRIETLAKSKDFSVFFRVGVGSSREYNLEEVLVESLENEKDYYEGGQIAWLRDNFFELSASLHVLNLKLIFWVEFLPKSE